MRYGLNSLIILIVGIAFIISGCGGINLNNAEENKKSDSSSEEPEATKTVKEPNQARVPAGVPVASTVTISSDTEADEEEEEPEEDLEEEPEEEEEEASNTPAAGQATTLPPDTDFNSEGMILISEQGVNVAGSFRHRKLPIRLIILGKNGLPAPPGLEITFGSSAGTLNPKKTVTDAQGNATTDLIIQADSEGLLPKEEINITADFFNPKNNEPLHQSTAIFLSGPVKTFDIIHLYDLVPSEPTPENYGLFFVEVADANGNPLSDETTLSCSIKLYALGDEGSTEREVNMVFHNSGTEHLPHVADDQVLETIRFQHFFTPGPGKTQFTFRVPENEEDKFKSESPELLKSVTCRLNTQNIQTSALSDSTSTFGGGAAGAAAPSLGGQEGEEGTEVVKTLYLELSGPEGNIDNEVAVGNLSSGISGDSGYFWNAPLYNWYGGQTKLIFYASDSNGNPVKPGTAIRLSTTSGIIPEVVRTNSIGYAETILYSGLPLPTEEYTRLIGLAPGEVRVTGTITRSDGEEVSSELSVLWTGSIGEFCMEPSNTTLSYILRVSDVLGNPLSQGTSIKCTATLKKETITITQPEEEAAEEGAEEGAEGAEEAAPEEEAPAAEPIIEIETAEEQVEIDVIESLPSLKLRTLEEARDATGDVDEPQMGITTFTVNLPPKEVSSELENARYTHLKCTVETENGSAGNATKYERMIMPSGEGDSC